MSVMKSLILVVLLALGPGLLSVTVMHLLKARAAASWPSTEARVESMDVIEVPAGAQEEAGAATYVPAITYSYAVDGERYESSRISLRDDKYRFGNSDAAFDWVTKAVSRTPFVAHFDPDRPSSSVLIAEASLVQWTAPSVGVFFTLIAIAFIGVNLFVRVPRAEPPPIPVH